MSTADPFSLNGRNALITGASRGIGRAIALGFARHGANVAIHYATRTEDASAVAAEAAACGTKAITIAGDLADPAAPDRIYQSATDQFGRLDILVLNASVQFRENWQTITPEQFDQQISVNLRSSLRLMQLAIPPMQQRKWGRVLAIGSVQQVKPHRQMAVYAATKNAQLALVRNIAAQVAPDGVTVNNLAPGVIATERNAIAFEDPEMRPRILANIRVGFAGQPEDCVGAALLLCSDAGRYITGSDFLVDGGWSL